MTDELDLLGEVGGAEPLRPQAYERARAALRAAMADQTAVPTSRKTSMEETNMTSTLEPSSVQEQGPNRSLQRRRRIGFAGRLGIGAGIGVAAAATVVALVTNPSSHAGVSSTAAKGSAAASTGSAAAQSPLLTLAAYVKTSPAPTGDAWLVKATQVRGGKTMQVVYTLYTDNRAIYTGNSIADIKRAMAKKQDQMSAGGYASLLKVAVRAASGNPADGRTEMLQAGGDRLAGLSAAAQEKEWVVEQAEAQKIIKEKGGKASPVPYSAKAVQAHFDNALWTYSTEALSAGDGTSQVRQGVLRLLSTISGVDVAKTTTNGKATLTITAGSSVFNGQGTEVLTIDASNGMLIKDVSTTPGIATASTTYQSSRVSTSHL